MSLPPKIREKATFAAGCFWGVEAAFSQIEGVEITTVGYTGGHKEAPSYQEVCSGMTGHAEAIYIEFDPQKVNYEHLLNTFWSIHDPTSLNRQGPDVGSQYRSVIFYHNNSQAKLARGSKEQLLHSGKNVVTQIISAQRFYPAEEYHQRYLEKRKKTV